MVQKILMTLFVLLCLPVAAERTIIRHADSSPVAPYSPGVLVEGTLYIAGHIGSDPKNHKVPESFSEEAKVAIEGIGKVLKDAKMDYSNVVNVTVYLTDLSRFEEMNEVYKRYFKTHLPARATVGVASLFGGARIEISAIAHK